MNLEHQTLNHDPLHPMPYTLHPEPYTPNPAPQTLPGDAPAAGWIVSQPQVRPSNICLSHICSVAGLSILRRAYLSRGGPICPEAGAQSTKP